MKSFSPAGAATKAYYGLGARTFGNPDGAHTGGGAYAAGGANPNGPNQGGGGGSGVLIFAQRSVAALNCQDVASDGLDTWVAVGGGAGTEVWRSVGGAVWALVFTAPAATVANLSAVTYGAGTWVVWGNDLAGITQVVFYSADGGLTWLPGTVTGGDNQQARGIAYGNGVFVANGKFNTQLSVDGRNFVAGGNFPNSSGFGRIRFDGADFLCANVDNSGCPGISSAAVSADGNTPFSEQSLTGLTFINSIAADFGFTPTRSTYLATEGDTIASSPVIVPWNGALRYTIPASVVAAFAYGLGQFIAAAGDGTIITSSDGIAWAQSPASGADGFNGVAFGSGMFVLVAGDGIWTYGP